MARLSTFGWRQKPILCARTKGLFLATITGNFGLVVSLRLFFSALLLAVMGGSLLAQDPTGTLEGRITDPSAARVPGAEVIAANSQTGLSARLLSSYDGSFH